MEVSAEVHFAQTLASNEKKYRDRALKRLRKYIGVRSCNGEGMSHDDFIKIWKGLHYCMWMQDKPLIQEELSQKMAGLLQAFPRLEDAVRFVSVFFITEAREWNGIDRLRLDKFMMLIRDVLHEIFTLLSRDGWPLSLCRLFSQSIAANVTNEDKPKIPYGFRLHIADIFVPELRKVSLDGMDGTKLTNLMFPFLHFILKTKRRELAQTMYEKTLQNVFHSYGDWSWEAGKRSLKKRLARERMKKAKKEQAMFDSDDDEVEMESDEEEEDESSDTDSADEEMDVEDDDGEEKKKRYKFDLTVLVRLMQRLAQDPNVESRARSYVYGLVNNYASRDPAILQSPADTTTGCEDVDISSVCELIGETAEKAGDKKKRKKKKKRAQFEIEKEAAEKEINNNSLQHSEPAAKKKKKSQDGETNLNHQKPSKKNKKLKNSNGNIDEDLNGNQKQAAKKKSPKVNSETESTTAVLPDPSSTKKNNKKRKRNSVESDGNDSILDSTSPSAIKPKKLKFGGDEDEVRNNKAKKAKLSSTTPSPSPKNNNKKKKSISPGLNIDTTPSADKNATVSSPLQQQDTPKSSKKKKNKARLSTESSSGNDESIADEGSVANGEGDDNDNNNTNTNARSSPSSVRMKKNKKKSPLSCPVQYVIYPQKKASTKPASISQMAMSVARTSVSPPYRSFDSSSVSPVRSTKKGTPVATGVTSLPSTPTMLVSGGKARNQSKASRSGDMDSGSSSTNVAESSGIMDAVYNAVTAPGMLIKRAVGLLAPSSAPATPMPKDKTGLTPEQLTPGSQKKVVFDLKKNKANKFKDYLKTLALEPLPTAFEPSKSPAQGILKSPSNDSLMSNPSPASNRKQRRGSKSPRTPVSRR